jgi:cobalt-zinc-cadmium efflux system outer membrane protein
VELALKNHPDLSTFPPALEAAKAREERASVLPNPELGVEVEGGSPKVTLSQEIDPWRRSPRKRAAAAEAPVTLLDREAARREVAREARSAFLSAVAADRRHALAREARDLSSTLAAATAERVAAGAVSPIEETRARVELSSAEAELARASRERDEAILSLAAAVGEEAPSFTRVEGGLDESLALPPDPVPPPPGAPAPPEVARWDAEARRRELVAEAEGVVAPPVTVSAGFVNDRDEERTSLLLGLSLPLPLFDRNRAAAGEARAEARFAKAERLRTERGYSARVRKARIAMGAAAREGLLVRDGMLAGAKEAFDAVEEGYRLGKFRYVDVIEAARTLVEARKRHLEALTAHNLARVELEALLAPSSPADAIGPGASTAPGTKEEGR